MKHEVKSPRDKYLFTSERLGFRNWSMLDIDELAQINSDPEVMYYFPAVQDVQQTKAFVTRMQKQFEDKGYCYFAVEKLENAELIGFIGLADQTYKSDFTPCTDIGWRLKRSVWNQGLATEGAQRCLSYAFDHLQLQKIYSHTPAINLISELIMKKIGMQKVKEFIHPLLLDDERLRNCVLYRKTTFDHKSSGA